MTARPSMRPWRRSPIASAIAIERIGPRRNLHQPPLGEGSELDQLGVGPHGHAEDVESTEDKVAGRDLQTAPIADNEIRAGAPEHADRIARRAAIADEVDDHVRRPARRLPRGPASTWRPSAGMMRWAPRDLARSSAAAEVSTTTISVAVIVLNS